MYQSVQRIFTLAVLGFALLLSVFGSAVTGHAADRQTLDLQLRSRVETAADSGRFHTVTRSQFCKASETAVIVCDMWDYHHCLNAVRRSQEMAPRMNRVLHEVRDRGAIIIHAPSSCMKTYADHPARRRAQSVEQVASLPKEIGRWCYRIPEEEEGTYPIDQSDGGEDDDPAEHAEWAQKLQAMGRNPKAAALLT